jgi:exopolysaccharide production protein ExoQ
MVPTGLCFLLILALFWTERTRTIRPSAALNVPTAWMFLAGSRWASSWLSFVPAFAPPSPDFYSEGSPIDAAVFFTLIIAGIGVLVARRINWPKLLADNFIIVGYFIFCLSSVIWTDEPFILLKRWIKDLGNPIMALVILTELHPDEAIATVFRRLSFLFLPLSILFIRYYPAMGRAFRPDGSPMFTGVGHQKNDLGLICLISGIYVTWAILRMMRNGGGDHSSTHRVVLFAVAAMAAYLLYLSNSQTALVCLIIVMAIMFFGGLPIFDKRPIAFLVTIGGFGIGLWALQEMFDIKATLLGLLGRSPTLTNRTEIWDVLKTLEVDPIFGAGFMSFWTGDRMQEIWRRVGVSINQAHNGYLEQYLNLGYAGVALIVAVIVSGLIHAHRHMNDDRTAALLRVAFIVCAIVYNFTEASFYGINNMWLLLLLGCLEVPRRKVAPATHMAQRPAAVWECGRAIGRR